MISERYENPAQGRAITQHTHGFGGLSAALSLAVGSENAILLPELEPMTREGAASGEESFHALIVLTQL